MRLNQYLASCGLGSRRSCESLILEGRVSINGKVETSLSSRVGEQSVVKVGNKVVAPQRGLTLVLNKPPDVLCSTVDEKSNRPTVFDLLPKSMPRLFYVGRLDADSEGLIILTNQGEMAQKMAHPRYKLPKTYEVTLDRPFDLEQHRPKLLKGFLIEPGFAKMDAVHRLYPNYLKVVLSQGLNRQIRRMFFKLGYEVTKLRRVQIGELKLDKLKPGQWRELKEKEWALLLPPKTKPASATISNKKLSPKKLRS